jgi:hypothetical protein
VSRPELRSNDAGRQRSFMRASIFLFGWCNTDQPEEIIMTIQRMGIIGGCIYFLRHFDLNRRSMVDIF